MTRIHVPGPIDVGRERVLDAPQSRHLGVLRLKPGDALVLFDGSGAEYDAAVLRAGKFSDVAKREAEREIDRAMSRQRRGQE